MNNEEPKISWLETIRTKLEWWLYGWCLWYCASRIFVISKETTDKNFGLVDWEEQVVISKGEVKELMEEAPQIVWRLKGLLERQ